MKKNDYDELLSRPDIKKRQERRRLINQRKCLLSIGLPKLDHQHRLACLFHASDHQAILRRMNSRSPSCWLRVHCVCFWPSCLDRFLRLLTPEFRIHVFVHHAIPRHIDVQLAMWRCPVRSVYPQPIHLCSVVHLPTCNCHSRVWGCSSSRPRIDPHWANYALLPRSAYYSPTHQHMSLPKPSPVFHFHVFRHSSTHPHTDVLLPMSSLHFHSVCQPPIHLSTLGHPPMCSFLIHPSHRLWNFPRTDLHPPKWSLRVHFVGCSPNILDTYLLTNKCLCRSHSVCRSSILPSSGIHWVEPKVLVHGVDCWARFLDRCCHWCNTWCLVLLYSRS